jgi:hypothetical protein
VLILKLRKNFLYIGDAQMFFNLTGQIVEVEGKSGITYKGRLVELGEREVHLESSTGWMVILNDDIVSIKKAEDEAFSRYR